MGESKNGALKLQFDRHLRLEFRRAKVTTDAGLLAMRELDGALGLTELAGEMIQDMRTGTMEVKRARPVYNYDCEMWIWEMSVNTS